VNLLAQINYAQLPDIITCPAEGTSWGWTLLVNMPKYLAVAVLLYFVANLRLKHTKKFFLWLVLGEVILMFLAVVLILLVFNIYPNSRDWWLWLNVPNLGCV
jgi:hypothetical protein